MQRTWSNAAAAAGKDPCIPALDTPYAAAAPMLTDQVMLANGPNGPMMTTGAKVAMGTPKTIDVALFSDQPTDDFTVRAVDVASEFGAPGAAPELQLKLDTATGHNGDTLHLTIARLKAGADIGGSEFMLETTLDGKVTAQWWGFAAN